MFTLAEDKKEMEQQLLHEVGLDNWNYNGFRPMVWGVERIGDFVLFATQYELSGDPDRTDEDGNPMPEPAMHFADVYLIHAENGVVDKKPARKYHYHATVESYEDANGAAKKSLNMLALKIYRMLYKK